MGHVVDLFPSRRRRRPASPIAGPIADTDRALIAAREVRTAATFDIAPVTGPDRYRHAAAELAAATGASVTRVEPPMTAAVVGADAYMREARSALSYFRGGHRAVGPSVKEWERQVFRWIREGPGFVGAAAAMYADWLGANAKLIVQERAGFDEEGGALWQRTDYRPALELLAMWRGLDEPQADLLRRAIFYCDSVGQLYQVSGKTRDRWWYRLYPHTAITLNGETGRVEARGAPDCEEGHHAFVTADPRLVDHLFLSNDPEWWAVPTSQMRRVMGEIELLILCHRSLGRDLNSRVLTNGIVHFANSVPQPGQTPSASKDFTAEFASWAQAAADDDEEALEYRPARMGDVVKAAPFPMQSELPPTYVPLGRDPTKFLEVHDLIWNCFCLGIDAPKSAIEGSAEVGSRWSGYLARDENAGQAAAPRMQRVAAFVEQSHLRPWWTALKLDKPIEDFRIWYELPAPRPDRTSERISVASTILPTRAALAESVAWTDADLVPLPTGMTEFEAAVLMKFGRSLDEIMAAADTGEATADAAEAGQSGAPAPGAKGLAALAAQQAKPPPGHPGGPPLKNGQVPAQAGVAPLLAPGVRVPQEPTPPNVAREAGRPQPLAASLAGAPHPSEAATWHALIPRGVA